MSSEDELRMKLVADVAALIAVQRTHGDRLNSLEKWRIGMLSSSLVAALSAVATLALVLLEHHT